MSTSVVTPFRPRLIFLRGLIWSLIGLIYAPLFASLHTLFHGLGLGHGAMIPAAALAGSVGAAFYGGRQVALAGTVVGVLIATAILLVLPGEIGLWQVAVPAAGVGAVLGGFVRFPHRCSMQVPAKVMAGMGAGAIGATLLALVEPLHTQDFHITGTSAFLVAVNGVLYVATVSWWIRLVRFGRGRPCHVVAALVIALLAATAAGSVWVVAAPLIGAVDHAARTTLAVIHQQVPLALLGGMLGGAVGGATLEAFGFKWVHDA